MHSLTWYTAECYPVWQMFANFKAVSELLYATPGIFSNSTNSDFV